jgi:hypothetical protein
LEEGILPDGGGKDGNGDTAVDETGNG